MRDVAPAGATEQVKAQIKTQIKTHGAARAVAIVLVILLPNDEFGPIQS
jgi:hypothetical protein